jgi:hypothetical protein
VCVCVCVCVCVQAKGRVSLGWYGLLGWDRVGYFWIAYVRLP